MRASATSPIPSSVFPTITLCLAIGLGGCNTFSVRTDYDDEADFATLTSFAWVDPPDDAQASPFADNGLLRKRVRQAGAEVLNAKGYREAEEADADFLVTFRVTIENRVRGYPYYGGYSPATALSEEIYGGGLGRGSRYAASFKEGTLILDLMLAEERRLIWRGWRNIAVPTPDTEGPKIQLAVEKILERFPPGI